MALPFAAAAGAAPAATKPLTTLVGQTTNTTVGGIGGILMSLANNRLQKQNNKELERLQKLQAAGALGLNPIEQRTMSNQLVQPLSDAASAGRRQAEQLAVAGAAGGASGASLSRLRTEQAQALGQAGQQVRGQVMAADEARRQAQLAEIEARLQSQAEMKLNDTSTVMAGITNGMRPAGAAAAAPVGMATSTPNLPPDTLAQLRSAGYSDQQILAFQNYLLRNPQALNQMLGASPAAVSGAGAVIGQNTGTIGTGPVLTPEQLATSFPSAR